MRAVEEAFTYRLVWALEAVRTRRMSLGWSPETVAGGAAAALETGVPQFMMSMLIRAGLPSRLAAMAAIEDAKPVFVTPAEMRAWLESDEITAYTDAGDWPTAETAALWARFRTEALSGGIQKWSVEHYKRLLDIAVAPPAGLYRIVTDEGDGRTWLATPDYQRVAAFKSRLSIPSPASSPVGCLATPGWWKPCAWAAESCAGRRPMDETIDGADLAIALTHRKSHVSVLPGVQLSASSFAAVFGKVR